MSVTDWWVNVGMLVIHSVRDMGDVYVTVVATAALIDDTDNNDEMIRIPENATPFNAN